MSTIPSEIKLVTEHAEPPYEHWSERLEIGVPLIDYQHKQFFELADSLTKDGDEVHVMRALTELNNYVRDHFRDEEALMAAAKYPGLEEHRQLHHEFRYMLGDTLERARTMTMAQISEEVRQLVNGWLHLHIVTVDPDYVPHVWEAEKDRAEEDLDR